MLRGQLCGAGALSEAVSTCPDVQAEHPREEGLLHVYGVLTNPSCGHLSY